MTKTSAVIATKLLLEPIRRFFPALVSHLRDLVCDSSLKIAVLFFTFSAFFFGSLHTHVSPTQDSCLDFYTAYISQRSRRQDSFPLYGTNTERTVSTTFPLSQSSATLHHHRTNKVHLVYLLSSGTLQKNFSSILLFVQDLIMGWIPLQFRISYQLPNLEM